MPVFDFRFTVDAPVDVVSAFHFEPGILKTLTPPLMIMQVHRFEPLADESINDFTMWMGPVPIRWKAMHSSVSTSGFTDTQVAGPMKFWTHTHSFAADGENSTEVHEYIEYEHAGGLRGLRSRLLFSRIGLLALFTMRKVITRREVRRRMARATAQF
jgi:ligand-binding SRPBCC domain-containing protein